MFRDLATALVVASGLLLLAVLLGSCEADGSSGVASLTIERPPSDPNQVEAKESEVTGESGSASLTVTAPAILSRAASQYRGAGGEGGVYVLVEAPLADGTVVVFELDVAPDHVGPGQTARRRAEYREIKSQTVLFLGREPTGEARIVGDPALREGVFDLVFQAAGAAGDQGPTVETSPDQGGELRRLRGWFGRRGVRIDQAPSAGRQQVEAIGCGGEVAYEYPVSDPSSTPADFEEGGCEGDPEEDVEAGCDGSGGDPFASGCEGDTGGGSSGGGCEGDGGAGSLGDGCEGAAQASSSLAAGARPAAGVRGGRLLPRNGLASKAWAQLFPWVFMAAGIRVLRQTMRRDRRRRRTRVHDH